MRRFFATLIIGLLFTPHAFAGSVNPQFLVKLLGGKQVSDRLDIGMFGSAFMVPNADPLYFYYIGPGYKVTDWWWTSPRTGMVINIPSEGASPIFSWWNNLTFMDGRYSFFTETEVYPNFADHTMTYYGYYSGDYNGNLVGVGVHGEQVNMNLTVGPHVSLSLNEHLVTGVEYHWNFDDGYAVRVIAKLKFN